jgi:transcriptional regulator with XRE-family HTH domain
VDYRRDLLRRALTETETSQSQLARISGVFQTNISQFLTGRIEISDVMLARLLGCLGYELEVVYTARRASLSRAQWRSWDAHRRVSETLEDSLSDRAPEITSRLRALRREHRGTPARALVDRWAAMIRTEDLPALRRVLVGLDTDSLAMREVSPMVEKFSAGS